MPRKEREKERINKEIEICIRTKQMNVKRKKTMKKKKVRKEGRK